MEVYEVENLSFVYSGRTAEALKNISFSVKQGEFITVCGRSGSGKSTLLKMLKPELTPSGKLSGEIFFKGRPVSKIEKRELSSEIGFIMQNYENQLVTDKVWHELAFGLESLGIKTEEIRARVAEMASFFGIQSWFHKNVTELSGGQKQILNLAAAMVMQPSVIILDEPASQLDPIAAEDFLRVLCKINRELGTTVIISEQRLEEVLPVSDRVLVLEEGSLIADGEPREVGKALSEEKNELFLSMPVPMRVYSAVPNEMSCPLTIKEGQEWLGKMIEDLKKNGSEAKQCAKVQSDNINEEINEKEAAVDLKGLWFRYEKNLPDVLRGLSLKVKKGEIFSIVGGNGAGKTTAISVISGVNKCYRGKIKIGKNLKIAALPQDPQTLFVKNTLEKDLFEMFAYEKIDKYEKKEKVEKALKLCELEKLREFHPYDLSGGEQQRGALAKVLLTEPDILLLDEPTKGLDAYFKAKLGKILKTLSEKGKTIIMVSHDLEFCAEFSDRCGMFFDGSIVSIGKPKEFFCGKSFYTTSANRMARNFVPKAVLSDDIVEFLGENEEKNEKSEHSEIEKKAEITNCVKKPKIKFVEKIVKDSCEQAVNINSSSNKKFKRLLSLLTIFLIMPATIFAGIYIFDDRKYYFISLLLIIEIMIPAALSFEHRKPGAREIMMISVFCAVTVAGRAIFFMLPQFKPVAAMVIIGGICFGAETGFLTGAMAAFVSNFFFGQGPWTPWQMFAFGLLGFLAGLIFKNSEKNIKRIPLSIFGFLVTVVIYGGIMNPASVIMYQSNPTLEMFVSAYVLGFPFDVIHGASTFIFLFILAKPVSEKLRRVKNKYEIN